MGEYLLDNRLDTEFQRMLFPLNLMQAILLQPRYTVMQGFVTPNGYRAHLQCLFGCSLVVVVNVVRWLTREYYYNIRDQTEFAAVIHLFDVVFYSTYALIVFMVNVAQSENNVQLVLKMQHAYRSFDTNSGLKRHRINNWMNIVLIILMCAIFVSFDNFSEKFNYVRMLFVASLFYFDGNLICAIQVIKFLDYEVTQWLRELDRFLAKCSETDHNELTKYLSEVDAQQTKLYQAYLDIMEAFELYRGIFLYPVLLFAVEVFIHPLIYIQFFLEHSKLSDTSDIPSFTILYTLMPALWVVKNFALLISLSVESQQFHLSVTKVDSASAIIRGRSACLRVVNTKRLCKKVWRVNAVARAARGLRACGALSVVAAFPLRLLALLATYTVVLLQFALL